jgi:NADH:ubiquinone oxidoreductase subunit C
LFTNERLIVFFYVDDIVVLVHPDYLDDHQRFEKQLEAVYDLRKLRELKWFLRIRVLRDWTAGTIWLIRDSFIKKVVNKFNLDQKSGGRYPAVPLVENSLAQSAEDPNHQRTQLYQQLVGSLAYISTFTRPNVARAHLVLAQHLQNPGQKHLAAVYHVWRYLYGTRHLAIRATIPR